MTKLGKLKEVDIRTVWAHEQYDFSKWIASEENIQELGEVIGLSLTDVETEKFVGSYRCDILCKDELTGKTVLIENQIESTNHDHLGKIITYASGLDAAVVVWIVASAKQEHASAIEWLNKHTDENLSFFLIEVHAYTIGDSDPAPQFKIIEQPNEFAKSAKTIANSGNLPKSQQKCLEFWERLNETLEERGKPFSKRKPLPQHWYSIAMGSSQCHIDINLLNSDRKIRINVWIEDSKDLFDQFYENKDAIEAETGVLEWNRMDGKKASRIATYIDGLNFEKQDNYPELINKTIDTVLVFRQAFKKYL